MGEHTKNAFSSFKDDDLIIDAVRIQRTGLPEVVLAENKSLPQIEKAMKSLLSTAPYALATRVPPEYNDGLSRAIPEIVVCPDSRVAYVGRMPTCSTKVCVVSAGTSDSRVALEAATTAHFFGHDVNMIQDVGVAGLHRLLNRMTQINESKVIIVVAGMEGALASVISGLTTRPVIAVPSSVGYGVGCGGRVALEAMLSSCAPGMAVMNIDNGFGAAAFAHKMAASFA